MTSLREVAVDNGHELASVIMAVADAVADISALLRSCGVDEAGSTNTFGDKQLKVDVRADEIVFAKLKASGAVASASSEEQPNVASLGGSGHSVAFDPLDGSSIIGANFAVGSIFGIWPGEALVGRKGADMAAAAYAVYGPRTLLVIARPQHVETASYSVEEYVLESSSGGNLKQGDWRLARGDILIGHKSIFAPANLRAAADNAAYRQLVTYWMEKKYTLRYTGGMVPDVHHIIAKGGGVFCSPISGTAGPKLRLLYECAPLAFIIEKAGGASSDGEASVLEREISSTDIRCGVALGSTSEVIKCKECLRCGPP